MILGIRTDKSEAEFYLYDDKGKEVASLRWLAQRDLAHSLLKKLEKFLASQGAEWTDLTGLFAYSGPGSFTGLRIGLTVMNTIAYSENLPIVGESGNDWQEKAIKRLLASENDKTVLPVYDAPARITQPKK